MSIEARLAQAGMPPLARLAWLELDLDALRGNLEVLRAAAGAGVRIEPVVKADAYGHGAVTVSRALEDAGADGLSVATYDEAVELRDAGISLPILVLYPAPASVVRDAASRRVAIALGPGDGTAEVLAAAAGLQTPLEIHLEVETGLGRGGVLAGDLATAVATVRSAPGVHLGGIWTHLAAADDAGSSLAQHVRFADALGRVEDRSRPGAQADTVASPRRHLAASGGLLLDAVGRWDAIRTGIALYGLLPDGLIAPASMHDAAGRLQPVMELKARPVRVVDLPAGHGVSYGPTFVTARPSRIATLPVGYADGWRRALTDRAQALVRGVRVPLVGRVAMDGVMVDVTDVPGEPVGEHDEFVLLGAQGGDRITAHDLASACGTITYEIVTGMSRRLARVYHAAGQIVEARTLAGGRN